MLIPESNVKETNIRFFTVNTQFKGFNPVTHEDYKALCLAILDDVERKSLIKFFSKYDTERYASLALFPHEQPIYHRMCHIVARLKKQVEGTVSKVMLDGLVAHMIHGTASGLSSDIPFTFMRILSGKLNKYYFGSHEDSLASQLKK